MDGLLLELDVEAVFYLLPDGVAEVGDFGGGSIAAIDKGEGMTGGDSGIAQGKALGEARPFEEPGGREFDPACFRGPVRDPIRRNAKRRGDADQDGFRNDGIFEERSGATAVGFALDDEHAFAVADGTDGVVDVQRRGGFVCEMMLEVGVGQVGFCQAAEAKGDGGDDVSIAMDGVEDAAAVGEAALLVREVDEGVGFEIEGADIDDGVGNLLAVGSDVLDGSTADGARDASEAFDTADSLLADCEDKGVPVGSGGNDVVDVLVGDERLNGLIDGDVEDEAIEAGIANEEIAAPAKDKDGKATLAGELHGFEKGGFGADFAEEAGRSADAEGSVGGEGDVLLDTDGGTVHGLRVQHG